MNKSIPIILSITLVLFVVGIQFTIPSPLFAPDGVNHFEFINTPGCESGYANGLCLMLNWLNLGEWSVWFFFLGISLLIPVFLVIYTKDLWLFPVFFVFTGFFWNTMLMQVFAQILVSLFFVFFLFEKNRKTRWIVLISLSVLLFFNVELHSMEFFVLLGVFVYELLSLFDNFLGDLYSIGKKYGWLACGVLSKEVVELSTKPAGAVRQSMNNGFGSVLNKIQYYFYSFFIENMLFIFVIPAIYEIFSSVDFRKIYYFLFVIIGAGIVWFLQGWTIWGVTRVIIWLPLVLIVPFWDWLQRQEKNTKIFFVLAGITYFVFNIYFYISKIQELAC